MRYSTLLRLCLEHPFYADGRCPDFSIEPSAETARLLRDHRCLLRYGLNDVRIVTSVGLDGKTFLPLSGDSVLLFHLVLQQRDFELFTDLTGFVRQRARYANADAAGTMALGTGPLLTPGVFADVAIHLDGLQGLDQPLLAPTELRIVFRAKTSRWAYYCVIESDDDGEHIALVDDQLVLTFTKLIAPDDPADRIARELGRQYPYQNVIRFLSEQTVACSQMPRKQLELSVGDKELDPQRYHSWSPLANPSYRNVSRLDVAMSEGPQTQDVLFQIINLCNP